MTETIAAGQLRAFIERIERVEADIHELNADKSEIYKELRGVGFDVKAVRKCVAKRKLDDADREEQDTIFDLYWSALQGSPHVHVHEEQNSPDGERAAENPRFESVHGAREAQRPATYGQLVTAGETAQVPHSLPSSSQAADKPEASSSPASGTPSAMTARTKADVMRLLRPNCQHSDDTEKCGGQGTKHCQACIKAAAEVAA